MSNYSRECMIKMIRNASLVDIDQIKKLEMKYYNNKCISERILVKWIKNGNFFVMEEDSKIVGSIYFEFLDEIKDLPWEHEPLLQESGKYIYISEISADSKERIPVLFEKALEAAKDFEEVIWLAGNKAEHDQIAQEFLKKNSFKKYTSVENWECSPNKFTEGHNLYTKQYNAVSELE